MKWKIARGAGDWKPITPVDGEGNVISAQYDGSEPLFAPIWAGDDRTPLLTLAPTWFVDAGDGLLKIRAELLPADSAQLEPGTYTLDVFQAGKVAHFYRGSLEILPSSGSASAPFSYIDFDTLATYAAQVGDLLDAVQDQTNFAEQRAQASRDFDKMVLNRYRPIPGRSRRYVSADGLSPGPYAVFAPAADGSPAPTHDTLRGLLGTTAVVVGADMEEVVSHLALSIIYLGQPGTNNPYREAGSMHYGKAMAAFRACVVEIDTDADGVAEIRIDQDVTFLS
jgi:hypothetical protein